MLSNNFFQAANNLLIEIEITLTASIDCHLCFCISKAAKVSGTLCKRALNNKILTANHRFEIYEAFILIHLFY